MKVVTGWLATVVEVDLEKSVSAKTVGSRRCLFGGRYLGCRPAWLALAPRRSWMGKWAKIASYLATTYRILATELAPGPGWLLSRF